MPGKEVLAYRYDDGRYIDRGRLFILEVDAELVKEGLGDMNRGKVGRPFRYGAALFSALSLYRSMLDIPYRQLEGVLIHLAGGAFDVPSYSQIHKRMCRMHRMRGADDKGGRPSAWFTDGQTETEIICFCYDSSGLTQTSMSAYINHKYGKNGRFVKLHIGIDERTKKIYAVLITDEGSGDSPQLERLVSEALSNAQAAPNVGVASSSRHAADGAYDTKYNFGMLKEKELTPVIPVRINFSGRSGGGEGMARKEAAYEQFTGTGHITREDEALFRGMTAEEKADARDRWKKGGYSDRQKVEIAFSTYKRVLGERIMADMQESMVSEVLGKAILYNKMMIDMAGAGGYTVRKVWRAGGPLASRGPPGARMRDARSNDGSGSDGMRKKDRGKA